MTDAEQIAELRARLAAAVSNVQGPMQPATAPVTMPNFNQPSAGPMPNFGQPGVFGQPPAGLSPSAGSLGLLVPVSIPTPLGEVTAMVQFGPEYAGSGQAAQQLIQQLMQMGWPVKAWQPKPQGGFGGRGGGGRGGW